jgi:hypothetical protein
MLFALVHLLASSVLAGAFVIVVLSVPFLSEIGMKTIPLAAGAGFLLAFPVAWRVTKALRKGAGPSAP